MKRLLDERPASAVTLVETPVSRAYMRKARIAFFAVTAVVGVLSAAMLMTVVPPAAALIVGAVAGASCGLIVALMVRAWPVLRALWHWAAEMVLAAAVVVPAAVLASVTRPVLAAAVVLILVGVVGMVGPVRRRIVAWAWCAVVRHRLRLCFAEFIRAASPAHPGSLPLILFARPTPAGERVWVWLRPGLDLSDLDGKTGKLAVACWASEVRVVRASARYAALVRVDITRRDPLTATVGSPLARLIPALADSTAPVSPGLPPLALDLPDVPEEVPEPRAARR